MNFTNFNDPNVWIVAGAAIVLLVAVLLLLARTGRKPHEGPVVPAPGEMSPIAPDEPLPDVTAAPGLSATELAPPVQALGPPDALTRMKGLGPKAEALLNGLGVARYDQIAVWSEADVARIDAHMGNFKGRIARDRWVEQARYLAEGDTAGFEERFGKLG